MIQAIRRWDSLLLLAAAAVACSDPFEPVLTPVPEAQEVVLHDFNAGSLLDPAAFDLFTVGAVRTDLSTFWDFVFVVDPVSGPSLQAREGVVGLESDAGIQVSSSDFEGLRDAPADDYLATELVAVAAGTVLTVRSRQSSSFQARCRLFGKLEVVSVEGVPAAATIRFVVNPNCEQRRVQPEE